MIDDRPAAGRLIFAVLEIQPNLVNDQQNGCHIADVVGPLAGGRLVGELHDGHCRLLCGGCGQTLRTRHRTRGVCVCLVFYFSLSDENYLHCIRICVVFN